MALKYFFYGSSGFFTSVGRKQGEGEKEQEQSPTKRKEEHVSPSDSLGAALIFRIVWGKSDVSLKLGSRYGWFKHLENGGVEEGN